MRGKSEGGGMKWGGGMEEWGRIEGGRGKDEGMEGGRQGGKWRWEGGRGNDEGGKEGWGAVGGGWAVGGDGAVGEGGGMEGGGSSVKWGREGSKSSLAWAHHHPCLFMCASHRFWAVVSWAAIFICGWSFPFLGIGFHLWVVTFVCGRSFQCGGVLLMSWWIHVATHGVVGWWLVLWLSWGIVATCSWWFVVICHGGLCAVTPASHIRKEEMGEGGYGTHLHEQWWQHALSLFRQHGTLLSPWAGLVMWCHSIVGVVHWCACVLWVVWGWWWMRGVVAVGDRWCWVSWMVGMVVVGRQPLFVVDHAQCECQQTVMFALCTMWQWVLVKSVGMLLSVA